MLTFILMSVMEHNILTKCAFTAIRPPTNATPTQRHFESISCYTMRSRSERSLRDISEMEGRLDISKLKATNDNNDIIRIWCIFQCGSIIIGPMKFWTCFVKGPPVIINMGVARVCVFCPCAQPTRYRYFRLFRDIELRRIESIPFLVAMISMLITSG
jgi:hypothetical protein